MATDNLSNLVRELSAAAAAHDKQFRTTAAPIDTAAIATAPTYANGTKVLDLVTGQKGVVVHAARENVLL